MDSEILNEKNKKAIIEALRSQSLRIDNLEKVISEMTSAIRTLSTENQQLKREVQVLRVMGLGTGPTSKG